MPLRETDNVRSKDIGLDPGDGLQNVGGRVLEIRKEKSRDAARSRRGKENYEFYELAKLLPLPAAITSQLDKASIIRLSISYLKLRDFCGHGDPPWPREGVSTNKNIKGGQRRRNNTGLAVELFEMHQGAHILQSLDGFAFTLSNDGRFLYISETVSIYLGLSQVEMAGSSMFDYVHSQDHQELADHLGLGLASVQSTMMCPASPAVEPPNSTRSITPPINDRVPLMTPNLENGPDITFCLRMKSTLTKRGVHIRSSGYRVLQICGQFRHQMSFGLGRKAQAPMLGLTGVAIALPPPSVTELRIEADTFIMRLTTQFKIIYCENVVSSLTDWKCEDLAAKNLYTFCHPGDVCHLRKTHTDLLSKGQVMSPSLRILNKGGGFIWVQMCATSLYNSKTSDDQTVLAIFQTISSIEHRGVVMDASHLDTPINSPQSRDNDCEQENDTTPIESPLHKTDFHDTETKLTSKSESIAPICESSETLSIFPDNVENDFLLDEHAEESLKHDNKLSRRKTDRPRKRKRDSFDNAPVVENADEETCVNLETVSSVSIDNLGGNILNLSSHHTSLPNSPSIDRPSDMTSPQLPEDLSFRPIVDKHNASDCDGKDQHVVANKDDIMTSSVKELEKVMNRHLPLRSTGAYHSIGSEDMAKEFSDAQKSSIQWSGAVAVSPIANDSLAASAFLRHLYTSRESVIRSNGRPHCYNGTEVNALNMLTPPSTDVCKDQLHLNIPHIAVQSKNLFTAAHKDPVSMLTSTNEEFNMTPPSSVSPQDKMASPFQDGDITSECLNMRIGQGGQGTATSAKLQQFSAIVDTNSSDILPKPSYLSVPNFQYHSLETNHFSHSVPPSGGGLYESRPPDHSMWYGSAYTS